MKPTELRIGNWVRMEYYPNKHYEYQIDSVNGHGVTINVLSTDRYDIDEIFPIPLTEEWLKKFGAEEIFPQVRIEGLRYWELNNIVFTEDEGSFSIMIGELPGVQDVTFDTVHELQNIFALTGKELEIK